MEYNTTERNYLAAKVLQEKGFSVNKTKHILNIGWDTAQMFYQADSLEDYKRLRRQLSRKTKSKKKPDEANINHKPTELYIYGLREDVFILAKVAEKMGLQLALTEQH
jgi:hypothetical protein